MATWEQVKEEWSKAEQMGCQSVIQAATVGQMLIELKAVTPHGEFMANSQRATNLGDKQINNLMTLAKHLPLLEQMKPDSQRAALALIKAQQPPKPKAIPAPKNEAEPEQEQEKDMKQFDTGLVMIQTKACSSTSGSILNDTRNRIREMFGDECFENSSVFTEACLKYAAVKNPDAAKADAEKAKSELPKSAQEKLERVIKQWQTVILAEMKNEFAKQLADALAEDRAALKADQSETWELKQKAKAEYDAAVEYRTGVDSHMTQDEFKLIRGCLHSDRVPDELKDKFNRAFVIFNRLEKTVNTKAPIELLRRKGWEKVSPFYKNH